jgi:hypothetical protein
MACPLDKLAPETRTMIYEYVLSFDTPLKHVTKMQPFVKKLTGSETTHRSGSDTETAAEPHRVNTSILTTSKLIYVEAIAVFYKHNTIHFDSEMCTFESLVSPLATDLSLARHVVVKIDDALDPEANTRFGQAAELSLTTIPAVFPQLRTCSMYISYDTALRPSTLLVSLSCSLRDPDVFSKVYYNDVGSLHVVLKQAPCVEMVLQSRWTIDRWANPEPVPAGALTLWNVSAASLYQASRGSSQNIYTRNAKFIFDVFKRILGSPELENVDPDGYEFWTCVEACLCTFQKLGPVSG